jgi:tetratricopeptide (TPR) repeat protein
MNQPKNLNKRLLILTDSGLARLEAAIFTTLGDDYTYQQLLDKTTKYDLNDTDTISKILKREKPVLRKSLNGLFKAVGLQLQDSDYTYFQPDKSPNPNFVGREKAVQDLDKLVNQGKKAILIQAPGGVGKTTLANYYLKHRHFDLVLKLHMAKETQSLTPAESVVEEWLRSDFEEEPGREFGIALKRLRDKLTDNRKKIGILIDNLEPALEKGKFISAHRKYVELLRVLTDATVESVTLITSRELLHEPGVNFEPYLLEGLKRAAWQEVFTHDGIDTGTDALNDNSALSQMHHAYEGNAEVMHILLGDMKIRNQRSLEMFWQANREDLLQNPTLENLVQSQFNKLKRDDEIAYKLLCRLGCYRYQEVPVSEAAVFCLLWDVPEENLKKRVFDALCFRGLVKFRDNRQECKIPDLIPPTPLKKGGFRQECKIPDSIPPTPLKTAIGFLEFCQRSNEYYLHPVMRQEALTRLKLSEDWETANRKAAEFWTDSVTTVETVDDALTAFEAYYHYVAINDLERSAEVILKKRKNKWYQIRGGEGLGDSFYRLGLLSKINAIFEIINIIPEGYHQGWLFNMVSELFRISGKINQAVKFHYLSQAIAQKFSLKRLEIASELNIGVCQIDIGEYKNAIASFNKVIEFSQNNFEYIEYYIECNFDAYYCLAFLKSCLGFEDESRELANKVYDLLLTVEIDTWSKGSSRLFLGLTYKNLGDIEKSRELYHSAISYAEESHYRQVKAKALCGLAECDRLQEKFDTALSQNLEAIEILEHIGAKCDLAEAYYQLGLTQQKMGNPESKENFLKAMQLFNDIGAPKQVEKVQQGMK